MLERIFGQYHDEVDLVFNFIFGKPHRVMGMMYLMVVVSALLKFLKEAFKAVIKDAREKLIAYTAFVIIGNIIDNLFVDKMFEWTGSTQFAVCLCLTGREIKRALDFLKAQYGIEIPLLNDRAGQLEKGPQSVDKKLTDLKQNLEDLEKQESTNDAK